MDPLTMNLMRQVAGSGESESYFFAEKSSTFDTYSTYGKVDDDGNIYYLYVKSFPYTGKVFYLVKYDSDGAYQWDKRFTRADGTSGAPIGFEIDSSGNVYYAGWGNQSDDSSEHSLYLYKFNSSGTEQWQREIAPGTSFDLFGHLGNSVSLDSSGNVYVTGQRVSSTASFKFFAKWNSSGTLQSQEVFGSSNGSYENEYSTIYAANTTYPIISGLEEDSSESGEHAYILLSTATGGTARYIDGLASTSITDETKIPIPRAVRVDSSGNIYWCVQGTSTTGLTGAYIIKMDTSFNISWQRRLAGTDYRTQPVDMQIDSSGNVYIIGKKFLGTYGVYQTPYYGVYFVKYNSSGTLIFKRQIKYNITNGSVVPFFYLTVKGSAAYIFTSPGPMFKVPLDGSLTGTYATDYVYEAETDLTSSTSSLTLASATVNRTSTSFTGQTPTGGITSFSTSPTDLTLTTIE